MYNMVASYTSASASTTLLFTVQYGSTMFTMIPVCTNTGTVSRAILYATQPPHPYNPYVRIVY